VSDPFNEGAAAAQARRRRSVAIALMLVVFMALVFTATILKIDGNSRSLSGRADVAAPR
jgi:thiol:disulfide interchange protein